MNKKLLSKLKIIWSKLFSPTKALEKQYDKLLKEARDLQRKGDIPGFAKKTSEAENIRKKIEEFENK